MGKTPREGIRIVAKRVSFSRPLSFRDYVLKLDTNHRPDHVAPRKSGHIVRVLGMSDWLFCSLFLPILLVLVEVLSLF